MDELQSVIVGIHDNIEELANVMAYMGTCSSAGTADEAEKLGHQVICSMVEARLRGMADQLQEVLGQAGSAPS
ncbi:TPA: hypothetical protein L4T48_000759 [Pseudomonas aeruginosa]|nr:hypothetical protein [Pseudomonas aeruginosa]